MSFELPRQKVTINFAGLFLPLLTLLFVGLKLTGHIAWSWWWVTAPLWLPAAVSIGIVLIGLLLAGLVIGLATLFGKK